MRRLVIALYDVAPPFEAEIRWQLEILAEIGVRRCVLNVVPNWHGAHPLPAANTFVELLHAQLASGSELVLHGLEHRRWGALKGGFLDRLRGHFFAGDAAEFLSLTEMEAKQAVADGLALWAEAALPKPAAFSAPGWLLDAEGKRALRPTGLRLIGMFSARDLRSSQRLWLPGFGYMGAGPAQELGVRALNTLVRHTAIARSSIAKVFLHPQGSPGDPALRRVLAGVARMVGKEDWRPATYAELWGDD